MNGSRWPSILVHRRWVLAGSIGTSLICVAVPARAFDPLLAERGIPATPAASMGGDAVFGSCQFNAIQRPLRLQEAVERTLCSNPKTREAWADVKAAAAAVGKGRSAYLPQVTGNWQGTRDETKEGISGFSRFDSSYRNVSARESP